MPQMRFKSFSALIFIVALNASFAHAQNTPITSFTPGSLIVMRGGDATYSQSNYSNGEVPAYLDEYSTAGAYIGTYAIPSDVMTLPGIGMNSHEGHLNVSGNGQFVDFTGYQQAVDPNVSRATDGSGTGAYYQVGQVSIGGVFKHTALDTSIAFPQYVRAAYSTDGTQAWVASKYNGPPGQGFGGGLEYISNLGNPGATTTAVQNGTDWRTVQVAGGQLYGGTGSSSVGTHGFYSIGQGAPTTSPVGQILLSPLSNNSVSAFAFATLPGSQPINGVAGTPNVAYVTGDPSGSGYLGKLYSSGGTPLSSSDLVFASRQALAGLGSPEGVSVRIDPSNSSWVDIFLQTDSGIYAAIDKSGASNGDFGTLSFTQIVSGTNDTYFYGLALLPPAATLQGDVNHDGVVNGLDIALVASHWLAVGTNQADANNDGVVNGLDIALIASNWLHTLGGPGGGSAIGGGESVGSGTNVPEPSSIALACFAPAIALYQIYRRRAAHRSRTNSMV